MALVKVTKGRYHSLAGTAAEVLQALSDEQLSPKDIVMLSEDATFAVFCRG